jgi:hypothetical protein
MKGPDLRRAEGVDVDARVVLADEAQQVQVPLKRQAVAGGVLGIGHEAALHEDLGAADGEQLFDLFADLLEGRMYAPSCPGLR